MLELAKHRIYSLHTFTAGFEREIGSSLYGLVEPAPDSPPEGNDDFDRIKTESVDCWLPDRLRPALTERYGSEPVFEEQPRSYGNDLFISLQRLISGKLKDRCKIYGLSVHARELLREGNKYTENTQPQDRYAYQLAMTLPPKAVKRISAALPQAAELPPGLWVETAGDEEKADKRLFAVPISIVDVLVYHFATNRLVCQVAIEAELPDHFPMTDAILNEMVDHAGRFAGLVWIENAPKKRTGATPGTTDERAPHLIEMRGFTLGSLVSRLFFGAHAKIQRSFRTYTHSYAEIAADQPEPGRAELEDFGRRLARQYTSDYALGEGSAGLYKVDDFTNVTHFLCREGGATIVDPRVGGEQVDYLANYDKTSLEPTYLPISVLNYHHHAQILEVHSRSVLATVDPSAVDEGHGPVASNELVLQKIDRDWDDLQLSATVLHSRFRFLQVSQISMHNSYHKALRRCFDLDEMEEILSRDLKDMSASVQASIARYNQIQRESFERQYGWVPMVVTGVVAGIFCLEFVNALNSMLSDDSISPLEWFLMFLTFTCVLVGASWVFLKHRRLRGQISTQDI